jgi:hypothetical protein
MLLSCQSITSQTSIPFLFVLNYEFPLVFPFQFVFVIPFIPLLFLFLTILDLIPFPTIKCGTKMGEGFFRPFPSLAAMTIPRPSPCGRRIHDPPEAIPGRETRS